MMTNSSLTPSRTTEISIVMFVGCMHFISRLYYHFRGPSLHATTTTTTAFSSKGGILALGGSGGKTGDGKLSRTVAKYMGSRGGGGSEDELELRRHAGTRTLSAVMGRRVIIISTRRAGGRLTPRGRRIGGGVEMKGVVIMFLERLRYDVFFGESLRIP